MKLMLLALWRYRHFVLSLIKGELKRRYVRSRLGMLWHVLNPLAQAAVFAIVLTEVLGAKLPDVDSKAAYPVYLMAGNAAWGLFSEIVNRSCGIFLEYASLMKKITFPRICLPVIVGGSALLNHGLLLFAVFGVFLFFGHLPGAAVLALPLGAALIALFGFGLGVLLGIFNVFARDVSQPLRVYSSGMKARLAFAVATCVRPEVLIVDEVLSVGDAAFQRKCFRRIEEYLSAGTALLFVSHNLETVKKLCDRALFLKGGLVEQFGPAKQVCDEYERYLFGGPKTTQATQLAPKAEAYRFDPRLSPVAR